MEVVGLVITAVAFVDQAVKTGSILIRLARAYPDAGHQISNAATRLEAQRYTLKLWQDAWVQKAERQRPAALADKFRAMWGSDGYDMILKCLTQLNVKFGEAFRTLRSIDLDSFQESESEPNSLSVKLLSPDPNTLTPASSRPSSTCSTPAHESGTISTTTKKKKFRASKIFTDLRRSESLKFWKKSPLKTTAITKPTDSPEEQAEQAEGVQQQRLSPGTKFKWSLGLKNDLRLLIAEIDEWLEQLETLSVRCEEEQNSSKLSIAVSTSKSIRAAAKALYSALLKDSTRTDLQFKLERERADSGYFDKVLGPVTYVDHTNSSFKFPLLISSGKAGEDSFLLIAEALFPGPASRRFRETDKVKTIDEIISELKKRGAKVTSSTISAKAITLTPMILHSSQTIIVVHEVPGIIKQVWKPNEPVPRCTFPELLQAESAVDPFMARWKRIQLACIITVSVLHLYETGWLSEQLETTDFHFFGTADSQYQDSGLISPYISPAGPKVPDRTPFDCLKSNVNPQSFLGAQDERLATLFYRLGIVLFEIGRGIQYISIAAVIGIDADAEGTLAPEDIELIRRSRILKEIEKIPFGRSYADLVKFCLTGKLYAISAMNIDRKFNEAVVERLRRLEQHFSAIIQGEE